MRSINKSFHVIILIVLHALLIGFTNIAGRHGSTNMDPFVITFLRYIIGAVTLFVILKISGKKLNIDWRDFKSFFFLMLAGMLFNQILFAQALRYTVPSHPSLAYATTPVWVILIGILRGSEKASLRVILASAVSILGVGIVLGSNLLVFNREIFTGDIIILAATFCWSVYTAFSKPWVHKYGPIQLTFILLVFALIIYFPWGLYRFLQIDLAAVSLTTWGSIAYMGIFTSGLSYVVYFSVLKLIDPAKTGLIIALHPPTTIILSILFGFEHFQWNVFGGTVLILLSLVLANSRKRKRKKTKAVQDGV